MALFRRAFQLFYRHRYQFTDTDRPSPLCPHLERAECKWVPTWETSSHPNLAL